jgi:hypothetical protein
MSQKNEQYHGGHEHKETLSSQEAHSESLHNKRERELTKAEKEHGSTEQIEAIRLKVEKQAPLQTQEQSHKENEQPKHHHPVLVNKQLKDMAFSRSMTRTRKKLSAPSRAFSKVVHAPIIDKSSELVGKTVARPSSMLAGAFLAFVGTSILLWVTRYYGYTYNYLLVILLFVGGAIAGIAGEGLWRIIRKRS